MGSDAHRWIFFRAGDFDQVKLASGADLANLGALDQKLWVALACPTKGLEIDARTLALIDTDKDGRVRAPELIAAATFACNNLKNPDDLFKGEAALPLAAINDALPEGKTLLASARRILADIGKKDFTSISLEDVGDPARIFADTVFNGDGVITEMAAEDDATRALIREIGDTIGTVPDRSGKPGIDSTITDAFFAEARAYSAWYARGEESPANVFPIGPERTASAAAAVAAIKPKVDDYFGRCRLAAFDPRALPALNRTPEEYLPIAAVDLTISVEEVAGFPLAVAAADRPLPLAGAVNPAHAAALRTLRDDAVAALLGPRAELTESDWLALGGKLAPYDAWLAVKEGLRVEKLGLARVREILTSGGAEALADLIARDRALEAEAASIDQVERLVRYHRDLAHLCTNFVSFEDFYDGRPAIFQYGTLYLDQRACHLCLPVTDAAKHATMAGLAGAYLAYLDCTRLATGEKMQIVAAFTAGESDNLMVGRNGVFYDRQGRDWDATITKIVDNPISIRQAFWAPYKKFVRLLEEQVAKRAAAADTESHAVLNTAATGTANIDKRQAARDQEDRRRHGRRAGRRGRRHRGVRHRPHRLRDGAVQDGAAGHDGRLRRNHAAHLDAVGGARLHQAAQAQPRPDPRRQRLGGERAREDQRPVRSDLEQRRQAAARLAARHQRSLRGEIPPWKSLLFVALLLYGAYAWWQGKLDRVLPEPARSSTILR